MKYAPVLLLVLAACSGPVPKPDPAAQAWAAQQQAAFDALPGPQRRAALFDAVMGWVETRYYDPRMAGLDWPTLKTQARVDAMAAPDDAALYDTVLNPLLARFHSSHFRAIAPFVPVGMQPAPPPQTEISALPNGSAYIRFDRFDEPSLDQVMTAIDSAGPHGVVLDLRQNRGGSANQQQRLLSRLLPSNTLYGRNISRAGSESMRTDSFSKHYSGPVVVLIGPGSASAAEITAATLKSTHRANLVGRTTAGLVLNAVEFPLPDGGRVQVPVADFLTPGGGRIEGIGVTPDRPVAAENDAVAVAVSSLP